MEYFVVLVVWKEIHNFGAFKIRRTTLLNKIKFVDPRISDLEAIKLWKCLTGSVQISESDQMFHILVQACLTKINKNVLALTKNFFFVLCLIF